MKQSNDLSEKFLLQQFVAGNEEAFDFIFRKYYKELCARAIIFVKEEEVAQGIVQECFIHIWEKRSTLNQIDKIVPFLIVSVRNKAIDYLRKKVSESKAIDSLSKGNEEETIDNLAISLEFEEQLIAAIAKLPKRCQEAFEYSRFEGLTYPEIAKRMNISTKAVEALIGRSLKILRHELIDYLPLFYLIFLKK